MQERLQKILSARGIASRRKAEEYITAGLVKVNGVVATLGQKADAEVDRIEVDDTVLQERGELLYYLMNKPAGVVTSNIERWGEEGPSPRPLTEGQKRAQKRRGGKKAIPQSLQATTVRDLLPASLQGKIYPVGRLDKESDGLLLLTNDGALAFRLTHPRFEHEKEYLVTVTEPIADEALSRMERGGMIIDGARIKPTRILRVSPVQFRIVLTEGRNRQIRRMCEKVGSRVAGLHRVRIMTLTDERLKWGQMRELTAEEKSALLKAVGM